MEFGFILLSILKIILVLAYLYGLLWALGHKTWWVKVLGAVIAYAIIQVAFSTQILTAFDSGLIFQASSLLIVSLGLNLIYGFNGQFSLGQWGFYGIGAYASADITYRWVNGDASGLMVVLIGSLLTGAVIFGVGRFLKKVRDVPVLSAFTLYLLGTGVAWGIAILFSRLVGPAMAPLLGNPGAPGVLASGAFMQVLFVVAILLGGVLAAEISFFFGLPVLTLGSDYFGIATLGFTIVVNTLMINSDTILPFPEMRGGRGMLGIPQMDKFAWLWVFVFMVLVMVVMRNLIHSSTGRSIMSVREDETAAKAMGINIADTKLLAFVIGSLFAGIGGAVYAHSTGTGFLSPATFNFLQGFNPLIIIVFGGLGSMTGTVVASFGWIFFLEGLLRVVLGELGTEAPTWRFVLYPITLLLLMLLRPQGLLGNVEWGFFKSVIHPIKKTPLQAETAGSTAGADPGAQP